MLDELRSRPLRFALGAVFAVFLTISAYGVTSLINRTAPSSSDIAAVVAGVAPAPQEVTGLSTLTSALYKSALSSTTRAVQSETELLRDTTQRAELMRSLAKTNPSAFLGNTLPSDIRKTLPAVLQAEIEEQKTLTGTIEVLHIDDFSDEHNSHFVYFLNSGGKRYELYSASDMPALLSGSTLRVEGYVLGSIMVTAGGPAAIKVLATTAPESVGDQKTLVMLVKATGANPPLSKSEMREYILSGPFQQFFKEQSYDAVSFSGTVTPWITLNSYPTSSCGTVVLNLPEISNYILSNGINLAEYGRVVFIVHGVGYGCSNVGKVPYVFNGNTYSLSFSWVGAPMMTPYLYQSYVDGELLESRQAPDGYATYLCRKVIAVNSSRNVKCVVVGWVVIYDSSIAFSRLDEDLFGGISRTLAHEVGHALGVMHANSWNCNGPSLNRNCEHREYGNPFDVMGHPLYASHFNAFYKDMLGWLPLSSKITITKTGTYSLNPLENTNGIRVAIVKNPALDTHGLPGFSYLEYRQPLGFDRKLPAQSRGLLINYLANPYGNGTWVSPRLINANYATDSTPTGDPIDWALLPGGKFADSRYGITLNSVMTSTTSATFNVTIVPPICKRIGFKETDHVYTPSITAGSLGYYIFRLDNNDFPACDSSTISITATLSNNVGGLVEVIPKDPFTLISGGAQGFIFTQYFVPLDASGGPRTLTVTIRDTTHNRTYTITKTITVIQPNPPPPLPAIDPSPADGAQNQSSTTILSWVSGAPRSDVYFDMTNPPTYKGTQTTNIFNPGTLLPDATYYWRINPANDVGTTTGAVWFFKTLIAPAIIAPTCTLSADPTSIISGNSSTLSWTTTNATSLSIDQGIGAVTPVTSGSVSVSPTATTTYTATVSGNGGSNTCKTRVAVNTGTTPVESHTFSKEFSSTQGENNWYYQYYEADSTRITPYTNMTWVASTTRWVGNETFLLVGKGWMHPGLRSDAVLKWIAPKAGTVRIVGTAKDGNSTCGDGVAVSLVKDASILWQAKLANGDTVGKSHDVTTPIVAGDGIYFIVNKGTTNNYCDSTVWNPTITYI